MYPKVLTCAQLTMYKIPVIKNHITPLVQII